MKRWLVFSLGLAIAAGALFLLLRGGESPPLDEIDEASRRRLEEVLRGDAGDGP